MSYFLTTCTTCSLRCLTKSIARVVPHRPKIKAEAALATVPLPATSRAGNHHPRTRKKVFTQSDLPDGTRDKFKKLVTPAWFHYLATVENIWDTSNPELIKEMQTIWDFVLTRTPWKIEPHDAVYVLVSILFFLLSPCSLLSSSTNGCMNSRVGLEPLLLRLSRPCGRLSTRTDLARSKLLNHAPNL